MTAAEFPNRLAAGDPLVAARDARIDELQWECTRLRREVAHEKQDVIGLNLTISVLEEEKLRLEQDLAVAVSVAFRRGHVLWAIKPLVGAP